MSKCFDNEATESDGTCTECIERHGELVYVDDWKGPVTDGNRCWHDLETFYDESIWLYEKRKDIPKTLVCMDLELPTWRAEDLLETLKDNLDDNHSNDEGHYWSEFLDRQKVKELTPKFQALINEFILASSWRTYAVTNKRIKVKLEEEE